VQYVNVSQGGQTTIGQIEQYPTPTYKTNQLINGLSQRSEHDSQKYVNPIHERYSR